MRLMTALFILFVIFCSPVFAQKQDGSSVLKKVGQNLNNLSTVSYRYTREMRYYADNYHSKDSAFVYMEFRNELPMGLRFQVQQPGNEYIYNGSMTLDIDKEKMTIDSALAPPKKMESNSFLYNSLATLRNNLPLVIASDSISKVLTDTVVNGRELFSIRLEGPQMYLHAFKGINYLTDSSLRRPYFLLVDKKTFLPYQYVLKLVRPNDDRDFISVTYLDIKTRPGTPSNHSWSYAAYQLKYKPYIEPVRIPVVKVGDPVPAFNYPVFNPAGTDSLSSADLNGKVVLLEFWFKSCGPCLKAMPHYNELQQKFGKNGFELVTINIEDPIEDIDFFYRKYPPNYKMLYNGLPLFESLGFSGCPSSLLVGRDGKAAKVFFGFDQEKIETSISDLLEVK